MLKNNIICNYIYGVILIILSISPSIWANDIISGNIRTELFSSNHYRSNDNNQEFHQFYNRTKLSLTAKIIENLELNLAVKMAEIRQENEELQRYNIGSGNRLFENHGIYLDRLYLEYNQNNFQFFAGKNTLNFGQAWKRGDYIWSFEMPAQNYRFSEKITFGTSITAGDAKKNGQYIFTIASYFNDNKYSDNSIITQNDNNNYQFSTQNSDVNLMLNEYEDDYTSLVGNDKSFLASYYTILDINYDFRNQEKLSYQFGYIKSGVDTRRSNITRSQIKDQKSFLANINYQYPINLNYIATIFIEYAHLDNYQGDRDRKAKLLTRNINLNFYQNYYLTYAMIEKKYLENGTNGIDRSVGELSAGYKFDKNNILNGLSIFAGLKRDVIDYKYHKINRRTAGLYLRYQYGF